LRVNLVAKQLFAGCTVEIEPRKLDRGRLKSGTERNGAKREGFNARIKIAEQKAVSHIVKLGDSPHLVLPLNNCTTPRYTPPQNPHLPPSATNAPAESVRPVCLRTVFIAVILTVARGVLGSDQLAILYAVLLTIGGGDSKGGRGGGKYQG